MTKIKITEKQAELLRSYRLNEASKQNVNKNVLKITKEQYDRIFASGLINETKLEKFFKNEFKKYDIQNLSSVEEVNYSKGPFKLNRNNPDIPNIKEGEDDLIKETLELVKYFYRKSEDFSPYWEKHNLAYDDICEKLEEKNMIVKENGKIKLSKKLGTPEEALKLLEAELRDLVGGKPSKGKSLEEAGGDDYGYPASDDPRYQVDQDTDTDDTDYEVVYNNGEEFAIVKDKKGSYYSLVYDIQDMCDELRITRDYYYNNENESIQNYLQYKKNLSIGFGLDDAEKGMDDIYKIDSKLKQALANRYDDAKDALASMNINEGGDDYGYPAHDDPRYQVDQDPDTDDTDYEVVYSNGKEIAIVKKKGIYYMFHFDPYEISKKLRKSQDNFNNQSIENYLQWNEVKIGKGEYDPEFVEYDFNDFELVKIDSEEKDYLEKFYSNDINLKNVLNQKDVLAQININEVDDFPTHLSNIKKSLSEPDISKGPEGETEEEKLARLKAAIAKKRAESDAITKQRELDLRRQNRPIGDIEEASTAGSVGGMYTAKLGMTNGKIPVNTNKMDVPVVYESAEGGNVTYDANAFPGIKRDGSFKKTKQTKAQKDTQLHVGAFVEFNDCTKLNNKPAGVGCSQGAVDNVVKLKKTSGNVSAPSL